MKRIISTTAVAASLAAAAFAGGVWWGHRPGTARASAQAAAVYTCPMHPDYHSDHPGSCPICGMPLEAVAARGATGGGAAAASALPPGAVQVSPERQQAIGVRIGVATQLAGTRLLRTTGRVVADENRTYPIVAAVSGWVRNVENVATGDAVKKDQVLASISAPESQFENAQQSYYTGLEMLYREASVAPQPHDSGRTLDGIERVADGLRNLGVSNAQLREMGTRRNLVSDIRVESPVDGVVLKRGVSAGLRFDRGFELYQIADLTRVWILADVYRHQLPFIRRGASVRITTPEGNQALSATVSPSEPLFDEATITLKVRLEAANPRRALKPGMFVDVEFPVDLPATVVVPADAIVDSGLRKTVFVDRGNGDFEPRLVETGWRIGDDVQVTKGLLPGERIVISGTFFVDSESRMKAPTRSVAAGPVLDPVCGMNVDPKDAGNAGRSARHGGHEFYFCSDNCKQQFVAAPSRHANRTVAKP
jgi:membrane fusion protein, copper/silver efflux system